MPSPPPLIDTIMAPNSSPLGLHILAVLLLFPCVHAAQVAHRDEEPSRPDMTVRSTAMQPKSKSGTVSDVSNPDQDRRKAHPSDPQSDQLHIPASKTFVVAPINDDQYYLQGAGLKTPFPRQITHPNTAGLSHASTDAIFLLDLDDLSATKVAAVMHSCHKKSKPTYFETSATTLPSRPYETMDHPAFHSFIDRLDVLAVTVLVSTLIAAGIATLLRAIGYRRRRAMRRSLQELNRHSIQEVEKRLRNHLATLRHEKDMDQVP